MGTRTKTAKFCRNCCIHESVVNIEVFFSEFSWPEMILVFWKVNFAGQKCRLAPRVYYQECLKVEISPCLIGYYLKGKFVYSGDVRQVALTFNETYLPAFSPSVNGLS